MSTVELKFSSRPGQHSFYVSTGYACLFLNKKHLTFIKQFICTYFYATPFFPPSLPLAYINTHTHERKREQSIRKDAQWIILRFYIAIKKRTSAKIYDIHLRKIIPFTWVSRRTRPPERGEQEKQGQKVVNQRALEIPRDSETDKRMSSKAK